MGRDVLAREVGSIRPTMGVLGQQTGAERASPKPYLAKQPAVFEDLAESRWRLKLSAHFRRSLIEPCLETR